MKKNLIIGGIVLATVGIAMGVTNPKPKAYTEYISEKFLLEGEKAFCQQTDACNSPSTPALLTPVLQKVKNSIAKPAIKKVVEETTLHQNLIIFSIYTTQIPEVGTLKTVGAFNQFFIYSKSGFF